MSATTPVRVRCLKTGRSILHWEETKVVEGKSSGLINPIRVATFELLHLLEMQKQQCRVFRQITTVAFAEVICS